MAYRAAIALGNEDEEEDVMKQKPRSKNDKLFTKSMLIRSYGWVGPLESLFAFIIFFMILFNGGWSWGQDIRANDPIYMSAVAGFFACVVICQVFNVISCRTRRQSVFGKRFFANNFVFLGIAAELLFLVCITYVPYAQKLFGTTSFDPRYYFIMVIFGIVILLQEEVRKHIVRRYGILNID
jgi:sodium/potassium-transporting ATPase subunit alpha